MTAKHFTESDFLLQQVCGLGFWHLSFLKLRSFRIWDAVYLCGSLHKPPLFLNSKSITLLFPLRTSRITVPFKSFPLTLSDHNKARGFFHPRTGRVCCIKSILTRLKIYAFVSSVRSSSVYHGLLEGSSSSSKPLFQIFQILQILKWKWKWKDPLCAKCLKDQTCAIFLKSLGFKDIEYDIPVYQM